MNTVKQLLNRDLIQIDETKNFSQVENKLKIDNYTVFYVANKKRHHQQQSLPKIRKSCTRS